MDLAKNGESSRHLPHLDHSEEEKSVTASLILPEWDDLPPKHLHPSIDFISLLHLDGLYNIYVRPYFDPVPESDDEAAGRTGEGALAITAGRDKGQRGRKKQGLSKGYTGLLEDCIDPIPMGNQAEHSLLPLIADFLDPPHPPAPIWDGTSIPVLPLEAFNSARLEQGLKTDGYSGGEKVGVREAEEKRKRKKQLRLSQSVAPDLPDILSPGVAPPPTPVAPLSLARGPYQGSRTPFTAPRRGFPGSGSGQHRPPFPRASAPPGARYGAGGAGGYDGNPGTPGTPTPRGLRPGGGGPPPTPGYNVSTPVKRPYEGGSGGSGFKRARGLGVSGPGGSRSASPAMGGEVGVKAVFKGLTRGRPDET